MDAKCVEFAVSEAGCGLISWGLYLGYVILGVAVVATIVLPLINTIKNPTNLMKSGIGIGVLVVVFAISFALSDSQLSPIGKGLGETEESVKWIGAGLIMFYIALFAAIIGLVYSEISKVFK
jgi:hypothetical protein